MPLSYSVAASPIFQDKAKSERACQLLGSERHRRGSGAQVKLVTQRHFVLLDHLQAVLVQRAWLSQPSSAAAAARAPASRDLPAAQVGPSQSIPVCVSIRGTCVLAAAGALRLGVLT